MKITSNFGYEYELAIAQTLLDMEHTHMVPTVILIRCIGNLCVILTDLFTEQYVPIGTYPLYEIL